MANIKKEEKDAKMAVITVRFTVAQKEKIEEEAKKNNMGVSGYIRAKAIQEGSPQVRNGGFVFFIVLLNNFIFDYLCLKKCGLQVYEIQH